ncbi:MAG: hypothetical protein ACRCVJ_07365 [Clostridium sp.]|uniref:hypothetical protein n=1 Tax=Clostridium sp. TaxID=1506 RepID=UPI003F39B98E
MVRTRYFKILLNGSYRGLSEIVSVRVGLYGKSTVKRTGYRLISVSMIKVCTHTGGIAKEITFRPSLG